MKIGNQKVVKATYELYIADENGQEQMMEKMTEEAPLVWCQGEKMMLPAFEAQVEGKEAGEAFDFMLRPTEAYGEYDEEAQMELPKNLFFNGDGEFDEERVYPGNIIPMNTVDGQIIQAQVVEVKDESVTIDLNHPYAGEELHFKGTIIEVREATAEELETIRHPHHCCGKHGKGHCGKHEHGEGGCCGESECCGGCE